MRFSSWATWASGTARLAHCPRSPIPPVPPMTPPPSLVVTPANVPVFCSDRCSTWPTRRESSATCQPSSVPSLWASPTTKPVRLSTDPFEPRGAARSIAPDLDPPLIRPPALGTDCSNAFALVVARCRRRKRAICWRSSMPSAVERMPTNRAHPPPTDWATPSTTRWATSRAMPLKPTTSPADSACTSRLSDPRCSNSKLSVSKMSSVPGCWPGTNSVLKSPPGPKQITGAIPQGPKAPALWERAVACCVVRPCMTNLLSTHAERSRFHASPADFVILRAPPSGLNNRRRVPSRVPAVVLNE